MNRLNIRLDLNCPSRKAMMGSQTIIALSYFFFPVSSLFLPLRPDNTALPPQRSYLHRNDITCSGCVDFPCSARRVPKCCICPGVFTLKLWRAQTLKVFVLRAQQIGTAKVVSLVPRSGRQIEWKRSDFVLNQPDIYGPSIKVIDFNVEAVRVEHKCSTGKTPKIKFTVSFLRATKATPAFIESIIATFVGFQTAVLKCRHQNFPYQDSAHPAVSIVSKW